MNVAINICPENMVDSFCNMPVDFCRGRIGGMMYIFTNILCTVKLLFCVIELTVLNYAIDGMSL